MLDVLITDAGFREYANKNVQFGESFLQKITIPDIKADVSLFQVLFTDVKMSKVDFSDFFFQFHNEGLNANFNEWQLEMIFQFSIQQTTYPYISDSGNGKFSFTMAGALQVKNIDSPNCKNQMNIKTESIKLQISHFKVKLNGQLSFLYDAILTSLANYLSEVFNTVMQPVLSDAIIGIGNYELDMVDMWSRINIMDFCVDERWIVRLVDNNLIASTTGQLCFFINESSTLTEHDDNLKRINATRNMLTNRHMQYNTQLQVYQKAIDVTMKHLHNESFLFNSIQIKSFQHTCMVLEINTSTAQITALGDFKMRIDLSENLYNRSQFQMIVTNITQCIGDCSHKEEVIVAVNEWFKLISPTYTNTNQVDVDNCDRIFVDKNWVKFSCNMFK